MSNKPIKRGDLKYLTTPRRPDRGRLVLPERHLFVTEGTKTEPFYLYGLIDTLRERFGAGIDRQLEVLPGQDNTFRLLEKAEKHVMSEAVGYQHVWILYDKDDFPADHFDNTQKRCLALSKHPCGPKYHAIWSNECFELWLFLHFELTDAKLHRSQYKHKLSCFLKKEGLREKYQKNDPSLFHDLLPWLPAARRNAKTLRDKYDEKTTPTQMNPCTGMDILLDNFIAYLL